MHLNVGLTVLVVFSVWQMSAFYVSFEHRQSPWGQIFRRQRSKVSPIFPHYPLCIYTSVFCLSVASSSRQAYQHVFPYSCFLPSLFSSPPGFDHFCPEPDPDPGPGPDPDPGPGPDPDPASACRPVPVGLGPGYEPLHVLDLPFACLLWFNKL
ncbi:hypothetical protein J4Q44_G00221190, partial [Coregonus suidteri]